MTITIPVVDLEENDQNWKQYVTVLQCVVVSTLRCLAVELIYVPVPQTAARENRGQKNGVATSYFVVQWLFGLIFLSAVCVCACVPARFSRLCL